MAQAGNTELVDSFEQFFRNYYDNEIKQLAQQYPNEQRSLHVEWEDLYRFDPDLADDYLNQPEQLQRYAEEALRLYDLPIDVSLGQAHVRIRNLPETESPEIRDIRARDMNSLVQVHGIVRKATDVRPKIEEAAFECQLCGTLTRIPQSSGDFQEPHECQGCERQGPFKVNFDQSEFVDSQKLRMQESPEGLRGGETPQSLDVHIEDDITGEVTPGDHVSATGVLRLEQQGNEQEKSPVFDFYMEGMSVDIDEEQFEDMDITDEDKEEIVRLSSSDDIYEQMIASIAPSIYGYDQEKLAMILQLFSGVTKQLPDGSRIRGDLHMLLIGDPGTGKCVRGETNVTLADGRDIPIRELVESNLEDPKPIDDGWYDEIDLEVPSLQDDGTIAPQRATKVWKRDAPEQMYRVQTSSGRELEVTPSHPLFVQDSGQCKPIVADELTEGQFVAAPRRLPTEEDDTLDIDYRQSKSRNAVQLDSIPNIGSELRQIRESLSLTQADCGLPRSTYQQYERGSRNPSRESLRKVVAAFNDALPPEGSQTGDTAVADGGSIKTSISGLEQFVDGAVCWDRIESIDTVEPDYDWVYDLEIEGTHNYISNGVVSHNSQMLGYIKNIAPRAVYTSGKGSSSAGLTAAAVRDDFGDGQQWTLEAGALVLADQGIAAVDELDKMRSEDRSAMHEALEQQKISVSKAGINATLKSRCSLLGAANPKYGRFDHYEPISEQIDLEPALISRFDLIFTVTDEPDEEKDRNLAEHIITTNYAGELTTQQEQMTSMDVSSDEIAEMTEQVDPEIDAELLRKYIAYSKQNCHPRMTEAAREAIRDFYVDLRSKGTDEDAAVPVTARKLEALVRLSEASARVRLSDTVEQSDAERVIEIVHSCLQDIGVDPETGEFDADIVEAGTSKSQRDRIKNIKQLISDIEEEYDDGAPVDIVLERADEIGMDQSKAEHEIEKLKQKGEVYEPSTDNLRTT
ncbi:helix-turn-helix domain-containing protein [Natronorubrum sp. JWXQ-INN-674]|uniref:DNA helicase n=1 Tax=Natronorubrum halalkaliphilum TaxID=2691917 RepID=A0A6B0VPB2_9EURY|nr:helix-turn-helix domain-containing protein [Natronorubrum halalkaliphilum]MXV62816.1 helix-turn-helix domain-containing protein [Natronorubrum halalkaliphilum]